MEFVIEDDLLRCMLSGEIDHHSAKAIGQQIDMKIAFSEQDKVALDFSGVTFMDSSGLALLMGRKQFCDKANIEIFVDNISGYPKKILKMAGADKLIKFKEN